jgi:hypothetical protein
MDHCPNTQCPAHSPIYLHHCQVYTFGQFDKCGKKYLVEHNPEQAKILIKYLELMIKVERKEKRFYKLLAFLFFINIAAMIIFKVMA